MRLLIDIGHPAHVHYYRNLARELNNREYKVLWTVKDIPVAKRLLDYYGFKYIVFPKKADELIGKVLRQIQYNIKLFRICKSEKITMAIGTSGSVAHVSRISSIKSIVFDDDDDDVQPLFSKFVNPFADVLLSPDVLRGRKRKNTIYYSGYHELAYLHPKRFTPNPKVLNEADLNLNETFFIMRFNVFKAHHDVGMKGLSLEQKLKLIKILKTHGKIFITTERDIEPELKEYELKLSPEKIHSLMAYATVFLGDSQTMTSEAAVLGIPSLRCNSFAGRISYLEEEENRYGLTYAFQPHDFEKLVQKLKELINTPNIKKIWQRKREKMLSDKIDVTAFWCWFIENYPESVQILRENPDYQFKFR